MRVDCAKATLTRLGRNALLVPAALGALAAAEPRAAEAATVDIFLIAGQSSPASASNAPFGLTTTSVYQLGNLNGNLVATTATLVDNFSFNVGSALTYASHSLGLIDAGETGAGTGPLVNSEVGTWDDVGIAGSGGVDKNLNLGRHASVVFSSVAGGFADLIMGESGALTPFNLSLCPDAVCSSIEGVFRGFSRGLRNSLLATSQFAVEASDDASKMDQAFLFRFSEPIFDYVRVTEFGNRNEFPTRLAVDYIGVGGSSAPISPVPGPAGLPLLATGLGLLGWARRHTKA